jgi:tRNA dimethylallyltransferase
MHIARAGDGEIVSVDSMQVYRGMDIGTAKPSAAMRAEVPHHLVDVVEPEADMAVADFQRRGHEALDAIAQRGVTAVICGGSGLHFRSLVDPLRFPPADPAVRAELESLSPAAARARLEELDGAAASHVDLANPRRVVRALEIAALTGLTPSQRAATAEAAAVRAYEPERPFIGIGIDPGSELAARVESRFDGMLAAGLLDEVARLRPRLGTLAAQAVGYKELLPVMAGETNLAEGREAAIRATRALAKRQRTFFRRDPRIHWVEWDPDPAQRRQAVLDYLDRVAAWSS